VKRIALLSNVNIDPVAIGLRRRNVDVWAPDGYGDIFGALGNPESGLAKAGVEALFILVDTNALLADCYDEAECIEAIDDWFSSFMSFAPEGLPTYVSNAVCRKSPFCSDRKVDARSAVEGAWNAKLRLATEARANVYLFPMASMAANVGHGAFFSEKLWYMARMPHTSKGQSAIADGIKQLCQAPTGKKVLALDLDNTLWGGVIGDLGPGGIELSDEHKGLIYKDVQREAKRMRKAGVILVVVSKNNPDDALSAFNENRHMALTLDDVASMKLNWEQKDGNLLALSRELNLGTDSFVFLDDNPTERHLINVALPEVEVLPFPDDVSELPSLLEAEYDRLFKQLALTSDDRAKAEQYAANAKRTEFEAASTSFESYLEGLDMVARFVDPHENIVRIAQLVGKTNQFNLTTIRYTQAEIGSMIASENHLVYAWELSDRFGNNGITAVAIVDISAEPRIDTLILSCRVMGKRIEDFVVNRIEEDVRSLGFESLLAEYRPTKKNIPVKELYDRLGYERLGESEVGYVIYRIDLSKRPEREIYVKEEKDDE